VCDLHRAQGDEERMFLSLASKPKSTVSREVRVVKGNMISYPLLERWAAFIDHRSGRITMN
jgi:hypothetical protein